MGITVSDTQLVKRRKKMSRVASSEVELPSTMNKKSKTCVVDCESSGEAAKMKDLKVNAEVNVKIDEDISFVAPLHQVSVGTENFCFEPPVNSSGKSGCQVGAKGTATVKIGNIKVSGKANIKLNHKLTVETPINKVELE